jgi:4-hydroxy-tetrahydrodipicolinate synthase
VESAFHDRQHTLPPGLIPATVVPMTAGGDVDWAQLGRYLREVAAAGPAALAVTADTGEVLHLTPAEQYRVVALAKAETGLPIVAGLPAAGDGRPSDAVATAVAHARALAAAGADALLVFPDGAGGDAVVAYHRAVGDAGLPLIAFQLQPALGGVIYRPDVLARLLDLDAVVALKEASFDRDIFEATAAIAGVAGICLLTGNDNFILDSFELGAQGALLGFGALLTAPQVAMIDAWNAGRGDEARRLGTPLQRLADVIFAPPLGDYRARLKECLVMLGLLDAAHVRPPLRGVDDAERGRLRRALHDAQLAVAA